MYIGNWSVKKRESGFANRAVAVILFILFFYKFVNLQIGIAMIDLFLAVLNAYFGWSFTRWQKIAEFNVHDFSSRGKSND